MHHHGKMSRAGLAVTLVLVVIVGGAALAALPAKPSGIGTAHLVVRRVEGNSDGEFRQLAVQDRLFRKEIMQTGGRSASKLRFADNSRVSVGPHSRVAFDEFNYDPRPGWGIFALNLPEGAFRFQSGDMDHSNYIIRTPSATVSVHGTVLTLVVRHDGRVAVTMESDDSVEVTSNAGRTILLDKAGTATVALEDGTITVPAGPPAWALSRIREMDSVLADGNTPPPPVTAQGLPSSYGNDTQAANGQQTGSALQSSSGSATSHITQTQPTDQTIAAGNSADGPPGGDSHGNSGGKGKDRGGGKGKDHGDHGGGNDHGGGKGHEK